MKTNCEMEKLFVTNIFSLTHSVFLPFKDNCTILAMHDLSPKNDLNLEQSKILVVYCSNGIKFICKMFNPIQRPVTTTLGSITVTWSEVQ